MEKAKPKVPAPARGNMPNTHSTRSVYSQRTYEKVAHGRHDEEHARASEAETFPMVPYMGRL